MPAPSWNLKSLSTSIPPWLTVTLLAVACSNRTSAPAPSGSASASVLAVASGPVANEKALEVAPKSYPSDLNAAEITRKLDCKKGKTKNACEVWEEFEKAGRFTGKSPSGEARWFGRAHVVEKGVERMEYWVLVNRVAPTAQVCSSCLPLWVSMVAVAPELKMEAARLWTRMSGSRHRGNRKNLVFKFLDAYQPKGEQSAISTTGTSIQLISGLSEDIGYLRQPELKRLLMVRPARGRDAAAGDGMYAEFWQAVW